MFNNAEIFSFLDNTFHEVATLHTPRHEQTATLLHDNRVLVVGGYNAMQGLLADAEIYDPYTNTWTVISTAFPARRPA